LNWNSDLFREGWSLFFLLLKSGVTSKGAQSLWKPVFTADGKENENKIYTVLIIER